MEQEIISKYEVLAQQYQQELEKKKLQLRVISWLRLAFFLSIIPVFIYLMPINQLIGWLLVFACLAVFLWLVKRSVNAEKQLKYYQNLVEINTNEINGIHRDFSQFDPGDEFIHPDHDFSYDFDLFGVNSFFQFLNRTVTSGGKNRLAASVQESSQDAETIRQKQLAIEELDECLDWRQKFLASGRNSESKSSTELIFHQNEAIYLKHTSFLKIILVILPAITLLLGALCIFDIIPNQFFYLAVFTQWILFLIYSKTISTFSKAFGVKTKLLNQYSDLLSLIENKKFRSAYLIRFQSKLYNHGKPASQITFSLRKILNELDYRQNLLVGFALDSLLLWDIRCIYRLYKWQKSYGGQLKEWFEVIAEIDSLISLANLNYNHPEWVLPTISKDGLFIQAENLGHPLIAKEKRIDNDFNLREDEQIVIITGANMAGKSTFLRTVGINLVLASMGCKVCAVTFCFSPVRLYTHMRTTDNLMKDESYFYAELLRLKYMLELLRNGENLFIIIDEMLKGTNSIDKLSGSVELLKQLIQIKTHCIVATHDLKLTELAVSFPGTIKNQCFNVNLAGDELQFDYKLKDGVTSTMNATFLMRKMGIIQ
jgi:DNA mismatch repair ATPase MutS